MIKASKENAVKAGLLLGNRNQNVMGEVILTVPDRDFMQQFIAACQKRLPSEESLLKDKKRRKKGGSDATSNKGQDPRQGQA